MVVEDRTAGALPPIGEPEWDEYFAKIPFVEPPFDDLTIEVSGVDLPSVQSKKEARELFDALMAEVLAPYEYVLTGDMALEVEWLGDEQHRYDTSRSRDVDNVIKPLLDSLCGPNRLIVDDNQIHSIHINWIDHHEEKIILRFRYSGNDYWVRKEGIVFMHLYDHLYMPLDVTLTRKQKMLFVTGLNSLRKGYKKLFAVTDDWHTARYLRPTQRLYHRGRLGNGFRIMKPWEYVRHVPDQGDLADDKKAITKEG